MSACPGSFPAFAVADSVGLLARRNCAARPSRPGIQDSGSRGISSALQSRGGDGFAPSSRHGVCGRCGGALRVPAWPGRCNAPGERAQASACEVSARRYDENPQAEAVLPVYATPHCKKSCSPALRLYVVSSPRRARKFTRGLPAGPSSTSSGASNTCSSNSF